MNDLLNRWNDDMARAVEQACQALVQIRNGRAGAGAGTIWHPDGLILTNAHVASRRGLQVTLPDGRTLPARVLARDAERDIAALAVEACGLPVIELGDSRGLRPGQWLLAVGHPWGVTGAATAGVVAGTGRHLPEMPLSGRDWIAVSLHLRPGHSGGPLVDSQGRLVGINTMMAGPDLGLAVPVHEVKAFLKETLGSQSGGLRAAA
ncbi:MAG: trypsin-like peptidase domain-containing protein [Anaerolineae bacterium]|nr:trypsin-like peptidase domain-containing protein [Anaerolineae bacterium]